jgi:hypothetical protein
MAGASRPRRCAGGGPPPGGQPSCDRFTPSRFSAPWIPGRSSRRSRLTRWGVPIILDRLGAEGICPCQSSGGSSVRSSGRGRPDGAGDRQACRRGRPRLGINEGTLGAWVMWGGIIRSPFPELNPVERARVKEMEDEIRRLRLENEFLKKRPSSRGRSRSRVLRRGRCGEGQLSGRVHVSSAGDAAAPTRPAPDRWPARDRAHVSRPRLR